jgi:glycosyltransferase involved in cell wall biosynthesis
VNQSFRSARECGTLKSRAGCFRGSDKTEVAAIWICCQLGAREHYAIPRAIARDGALRCLATDAWVHPGSPHRIFGRRLRNRYHPELKNSLVKSFTASLIAFELRARFQGKSGWPLIMARNAWFQDGVTRWLSGCVSAGSWAGNSPSVVFGYSYAALEIFRFAKRQGWPCVLGQIDPGPVEERIVSELRAEYPDLASSWKRAPERYWKDWREECELADRILVNSTWSRESLVSAGVPDEKIVVVPLAYDGGGGLPFSPRRIPSEFSKERPLCVLFLGQVIVRKGIQDLLAAAAALQRLPVVFVVAGGGGGVPSGVPANVRFLGPVLRSDVNNLYDEADVFAIPTHSDGFAITQLEAMSRGLPVLATNRCGAVVEQKINGWIVEPGKPEQIAAVLSHVISNPTVLEPLSLAARRRSGEFELDCLRPRLAEITSSLLTG